MISKYSSLNKWLTLYVIINNFNLWSTVCTNDFYIYIYILGLCLEFYTCSYSLPVMNFLEDLLYGAPSYNDTRPLDHNSYDSTIMSMFHMTHAGLTPSQWKTPLQSNVISHWLGANLESALHMVPLLQSIYYVLYIDTWTKWQTFCRQHFKNFFFFVWKCLNFE